MSKKFDASFMEVMKFEPEGLYISRKIFPTKEDAILAFTSYFDDIGGSENDVNPDEIKEAYVRFGPTPWDLRDELGNMAWMVCDRNNRGAQPCWVL